MGIGGRRFLKIPLQGDLDAAIKAPGEASYSPGEPKKLGLCATSQWQ
jgi:hypothetical protein